MEDGKFTMFAGKAVALAEVFKFTVGKEPFVGSSVCRLELSAPTEESTDGGRLAVQHVSIVPENGGPTMVIATAYQVERRAEVRPYEAVVDAYKKRFHASSSPVSPGQFDEMTRRLKEFFQQFGFTFAVASPLGGPSISAPTRDPTPGALTPVQSAKRHNAGGRAMRTASRVATDDDGGPRAGGSRLWIVLASVAVAAAAASGTAVYFLR
jgi:hypothetical protein